MGKVVVALTKDEQVRKEKGKGRPVFGEIKRATCLMMVKGIEDVFLVNDVLDALKSLKPDIFVKGKDYIGRINPEHEAYCKANSIEIRFTNTDKYSSTELLNWTSKQSGT